jgi:hypothetical protein
LYLIYKLINNKENNMILKEDLAKNKWCPFARVASSTVAYNRTADGYTSSAAKCVGAQCMLWSYTNNEGKLGTCGLVNSSKLLRR